MSVKFPGHPRYLPSLLYLAATTALMIGPLSKAQTPGSSTEVATNTLQEIVVTAEKRKSTVQETAISITALTSDQMADKGITSIEQVVQAVPGVSMTSAGPGQTEIEMRGIASGGGSAPTVGFYLDDFPLPPSVSSLLGKDVVSPDMYDLNRAEVLRGPQGTLYGSGSMGGTIRLITNAPKLNKLSGTVEVDGSGTQGGNTPNWAAKFALNIPLISDVAALRVVLGDKRNSGWIDRIVENPFPEENNDGCTPNPSFKGCNRGNVLTGNVVAKYQDVNWEHTSDGRIELLVEPTKDLKITTSAYFNSTSQGGENTVDDPPGLSHEAHYSPADIAEPYFDKWQLYGNTIAYDLHFAQLSASTSYFNRNSVNYQDTAEADENYFQLPAYITDNNQYNYNSNPTHEISEEVRLASEGTHRYTWLIGYFYSNLYNSLITGVVTPELCFLSNGGCAANPQGIQAWGIQPYRLNNWAAFGEASYKISPTFTATLGLREYDFRIHQTYTESGIFASTGNATPVYFEARENSKGLTPKVALSYQPTGNLNIYGSFSSGIRPGGTTVPVPVAGPVNCLPSLELLGLSSAPTAFGPDKVYSYELGEKALLDEGRLRVNGDVFYNDWKNVQANVLLQCGYSFAGNGGDARTYGPELEVAYKLTRELTLELNGSFTRAYYYSVLPSAGLNVGQPILNVAKYTESTSISYEKPLGAAMDLRADLTNMYVGPRQDESFAYVNLRPYDLVNARVQIDRGAFTYGLYVNNLTNDHAELSSSITILTVSMPDLIRYTTNQPRTIGFNVGVTF